MCYFFSFSFLSTPKVNIMQYSPNTEIQWVTKRKIKDKSKDKNKQ